MIGLIVGTFKSGAAVLRVGGSAGARSDTQDLINPGVGVHANADGTIALRDSDGNSCEFVVKAGGFYPYRIARVLNTGTTLTNSQFNILYGPGAKLCPSLPTASGSPSHR